MRFHSTLRAHITAFAAGLCLLGLASSPSRGATSDRGQPIDLVIALDTSGTMRTLAESAQVKIWEIVNDLAIADPVPDLRVGLVTYGNQTGSEANGWVRIESDLTSDLDRISERLFALRSRGANEYVARALQVSLERLSWSDAHDALQLLFVVGNEAPDQDPYVSYQEMSELAADRGIFLSAVFCGQSESAEARAWKEMAALAEGQFASIDHRLEASVAATPVDEQLVELGELINQTFVPYNEQGKTRSKSRAREDKNARKQGTAVAATRAITKASSVYSFDEDLVEAYASGELDIATLESADLPRELRRLPPEERRRFLEDMNDIRTDLRARISDLGAERRRMVQERSGAQDASARALDRVLRTTIRAQAEEAGFEFPEE